jgi:hypothetical protein
MPSQIRTIAIAIATVVAGVLLLARRPVRPPDTSGTWSPVEH